MVQCNDTQIFCLLQKEKKNKLRLRDHPLRFVAMRQKITLLPPTCQYRYSKKKKKGLSVQSINHVHASLHGARANVYATAPSTPDCHMIVPLRVTSPERCERFVKPMPWSRFTVDARPCLSCMHAWVIGGPYLTQLHLRGYDRPRQTSTSSRRAVRRSPACRRPPFYGLYR